MKPLTKKLLIIIPTVTTVIAVIAGFAVYFAISYKNMMQSILPPDHSLNSPSDVNKPNFNSILNQEKAKENFSNDVWKNKTFLSAKDFNGYDALTADSFDELNLTLEYIELPSSI